MTQVVMLADRVWEAVAAVTDPEYPDLTIVDLGILERIEVDAEGRAEIGLVPTALGCPALAQIRSDVGAAAQAAGAVTVEVTFLTTPTWTPERIQPAARRFLAREMTVAVRGSDGQVVCPVCGSKEVALRSEFGATLCRQLWWCDQCRNPVEVVRR
jgi:ring-1,2-phenylacetyl-CoA epoxidase subunit PaaD